KVGKGKKLQVAKASKLAPTASFNLPNLYLSVPFFPSQSRSLSEPLGPFLKFQAQRHPAQNPGDGQARTASRGEAKVAQRTSAQDRAQLHTWVHPRSGPAAGFGPAHNCLTR